MRFVYLTLIELFLIFTVTFAFLGVPAHSFIQESKLTWSQSFPVVDDLRHPGDVLGDYIDKEVVSKKDVEVIHDNYKEMTVKRTVTLSYGIWKRILLCGTILFCEMLLQFLVQALTCVKTNRCGYLLTSIIYNVCAAIAFVFTRTSMEKI